MLGAYYQIFPSEENYSYTPVQTQESFSGAKAGDSSEHVFSKVVVALIIILFSVGIIYLAYSLFLKDLILLLKAKKQRTTTEIGFGNTPGRPGSQPQQNVGPI
ncbi:V2 [Chickpea chlorosis virus-A]|uniref:Movement protein n=1 Tax=Chickpea chlorosis virus-A TaxID=887825 RepID=E5DE80_9GEMI|nr:V2 [Chickpea chlorosis virus-A]ADQ52685.1 V2 [Chickpea chlorosis virus-A]AFD62963.1 movement protein [Chickpea chlorosis virus-A]AGT45402.1 movement protein [Chickpea chlorosis virus-A]